MGSNTEETGPQHISNVRVAVRIRPLTSSEASLGGKSVISTNGQQRPSEYLYNGSSKSASATEVVILGAKNRRFTFDEVFDGSMQQEDLYQSVSGGLLKSFLSGYNATIMAYGQTGSGKTFTMGSEHGAPTSSSNSAFSDLPASAQARLGLIPRFMKDIFQHLNSIHSSDSSNNETNKENSNAFELRASFLEVYGEDVHDLLTDDDCESGSRAALPLREDGNGAVSVVGLKSLVVKSAVEALQALQQGTLHRTTASTLMNVTSSRSHAIFVITLTTASFTSNFTFVDLAGSERLKKTGAEGARAREGIDINKGLLALGNVINALADEDRIQSGKQLGHVPYRQSKLTRLLQDALGGNSQTLFLACVSPSDTNASETLSTLHYANRARNIKNAPIQNVDANLVAMKRLECFNTVLQNELVKQVFLHKEDERADENDVQDEDCNVEILLQRIEVQQYLSKLYELAMESQNTNNGRSITNSNNEFSNESFLAIDNSKPTKRSNKSTVENLLLDTSSNGLSPEDDMQILDTLLTQINQQDEESQEQVKAVDNELAEQENLLLQLRDHLKVYHNIKESYENLLVEVQALEQEKVDLKNQLEKVTSNPRLGCPNSIKEKLERVEANLKRARSETRHQHEMYKKMEAEALKCRALETKIKELKSHRVELIRRQKELSHKHQMLVKENSREIMQLKKLNRKTDQRYAKLEEECRKYKAHLARRNDHSKTLSSKLKQTESHLLKLLSMRKRELQDRYNKGQSRKMYRMSFVNDDNNDVSNQNDIAKLYIDDGNREYQSANFVLQKLVSDRVERQTLQRQYKVAIEKYETLSKQISTNGVDDDEGMQLQLELLGSDLEELQSRIEMLENSHGEKHVEDEKEAALVGSLSAPILRTLLWNNLDQLSQNLVDNNVTNESLKRKIAGMHSLEDENEQLKLTVQRLSQEFERKKSLLRQSGVSEENVKYVLKTDEKLRSLQSQYEKILNELHRTKRSLREKEEKLSHIEGKHSINKASQDVTSMDSSKLEEIQRIYLKLGVTYDLSKKFDNLVSDTLTAELQAAKDIEDNLSKELLSITNDARSKCEQLDIPLPKPLVVLDEHLMLAEKLEIVKSEQKVVHKKYEEAIDRRTKIIDSTKSVIKSLGWDIDHAKIASCLKLILNVSDDELTGNDSNSTDIGKAQRQALLQHVEQIVDSALNEMHSDKSLSLKNDGTKHRVLSGKFLDKCEESLSELKRQKSNQFLQNIHILSECSKLATDMNLTKNEVKDLTSLYISRYHHDKAKLLLSSKTNLQAISFSIATANQIPSSATVAKSDEMYSELLSFVYAALTSVASNRQNFSEALRKEVEYAQIELLKSVSSSEIETDQNMDNTISEALQGFNDALHRLPRLSKELILSCIEELRALTSAAESMTASEIEALTLVWEALGQDVSPQQRQDFWIDLEEGMKTLEVEVSNPFDSITTGSSILPDEGETSTKTFMVEDWIYSAIRDATKAYRLLSLRLYKLSKVHTDVERNRSLQDTKSRILTLDSEICITSVQLNEFEEKAGSKQRLLNKKKPSINLLREEKFRKQMQAKVASQFANIVDLLNKWEDLAKQRFSIDRLSIEVKTLLDQEAHYNVSRVTDAKSSWAEETTAFMHLRTTTAIKRTKVDDKPSQLTPAISVSKEQVAEHESSSESDASFSRLMKKNRSDQDLSNNSNLSSRMKSIISPNRIHRGAVSSAKSSISNKSNQSTSRSRSAQSSRSTTPSTTRSVSPAPNQLYIRGNKKDGVPRSISRSKYESSLHRSNGNKSPLRRTNSIKSNEMKKAGNNHQGPSSASKVSVKPPPSKRSTLMPFESILKDTPVKDINKENSIQ